MIIMLIILLISNTLYSHINPPCMHNKKTWAETRLKKMSINEKIGQLFMVDAVADPNTCGHIFLAKSPYKIKPKYVEMLIKKYHVGGILFLGRGTPKKQVEITQQFQKISKTPLLIGQDLEWGLHMRLKNTIQFPRAMTLGAIAQENEHLIYDLGKEIGRECAELGVHINFAPVADINSNPENPVIGTRSFGQDKIAVARKSRLFMHGLQDAGILACAKHFPGHGDTDMDSHYTLPRIMHDKKRLTEIELYPFEKLIESGISAVMSGHLEIPALEQKAGLPASLSHAIITDLLRQKLQFNGLIITDALGMRGVTKRFNAGEIALHALKAGNDILLASTDVPKAIAAIKKAIENGTITETELNNHVRKILHAKEWVLKQQRAENNIFKQSDIITDYAQELQEKLYAAAITLVKNNNNVLPLQKLDTAIPVVVVGDNAENVFCKKLKEYIKIKTYTLPSTLSKSEQKTLIKTVQNEKMIIISVHQNNTCVADIIDALHTHNVQTIVVSFENPYTLSDYNNADALLAAYENVSCAQHITARTLIGKHKPTGIVPVKHYQNY